MGVSERENMSLAKYRSFAALQPRIKRKNDKEHEYPGHPYL
jgi:hypothetical protein